MKNRNTKIKFTDIAGMLDRDQMREIIGGCGQTYSCGGYNGSGALQSVQYSGGNSLALSNAFFIANTSGYTPPTTPSNAGSSGVSSTSLSNAWNITSNGVTTNNPIAISRLLDLYYANKMALTSSQINTFITNEFTAAGQAANNLLLPGTLLSTVYVQNNYHGPSTIPQGIVINNGVMQINPAFFSSNSGNPIFTGSGVIPITSHGSVYKPTSLDAAIMSKYVYGGVDADELLLKKTGWSVSHAADGKGIIFNAIYVGFKSQLFEKTLPNGSKEYCYVTAGTEDLKDMAANVVQLMGASQQYVLSTENAKALATLFGGSLSFAGHSLGGGLAEANALATGDSALTFNAAGLSLLTTGFSRSSNTDAYIMTNDPLNLLQQASNYLPSAGGNVHYLNNGASIIDAHSINTVIKALGGTP